MPVECASEDEAKTLSAKRQAEGAKRQVESAKPQAGSAGPLPLPASRSAQGWPCHFFKSDTTGEKEFESFFAQGEQLVLDRFKCVGVVQQEKLVASR